MAKYTLFGPKPQPVLVDAAKPRIKSDNRQLSDTYFPCTFRGIHFPVTFMSVSFSQDMAEHKYYGVGGANVEMTGSNPRTFEAEIPFVNGIAPGKNERWGVLYPEAFREFTAAMGTRSTGYLDTPEIRGLSVKPVSFDYKHDANTRDGVIVTAKWIETVDQKVYSKEEHDPDDHAIRLAALKLDAEYTPGRRVVLLPAEETSFEDLANQVSGAIDTAASKFNILANKPAQILYRVKRVQDSLDRAKNALTWPIREASEKLENAARNLKKLPGAVEDTLAPGFRIHHYTAATRMTLSQLALATHNSVDELLQLNPQMASRPAVPANTKIRYYNHGKFWAI